MQARGARVLVTLSLLFGALVATSAPAASVTADSTITYVSDPGDSVGLGRSATFTSAGATFSFRGDARSLTVIGIEDGYRSFLVASLAPPPGHRLDQLHRFIARGVPS